MDWASVAVVLPTGLSAAFYTLVQSTAFWVMAARKPSPRFSYYPSVSILKPIAGADDELLENLESFAAIDYPSFEVLFGITSTEDPAYPILLRFIASHPGLSARVVLTTPARRPIVNPKVAQLIDLTKQAKGTVLVVSDANVRVSPSYLRSLVGTLSERGVGLVSSIICGCGERSFGAAIENAQLGGYVGPAVVAAHHLFRRPVTIGKSMAMRRADLERAGGWEAVGGVLAEDDMMGIRFRAMGYSLRLSLDPVFNCNVRGSLRRSIERHARWAKMRRSVAPLYFPFEPLLTPLLVATAVFFLMPSPLSAKVWFCALGLQYTGALLSHTLHQAKHPLAMAALEPLRIFAHFTCWILAAVSRRVAWRGNAFLLGAGSRLIPISTDREEEIATGR